MNALIEADAIDVSREEKRLKENLIPYMRRRQPVEPYLHSRNRLGAAQIATTAFNMVVTGGALASIYFLGMDHIAGMISVGILGIGILISFFLTQQLKNKYQEAANWPYKKIRDFFDIANNVKADFETLQEKAPDIYANHRSVYNQKIREQGAKQGRRFLLGCVEKDFRSVAEDSSLATTTAQDMDLEDKKIMENTGHIRRQIMRWRNIIQKQLQKDLASSCKINMKTRKTGFRNRDSVTELTFMYQGEAISKVKIGIDENGFFNADKAGQKFRSVISSEQMLRALPNNLVFIRKRKDLDPEKVKQSMAKAIKAILDKDFKTHPVLPNRYTPKPGLYGDLTIS